MAAPDAMPPQATSVRYRVVAEIGLAANQYGAQVELSDVMTRSQALLHLREVVAGRHPAFFTRPDAVEVLRVSEVQHLVVEHRTVQPGRMTRLTVVEDLGPS